MKSDRKEITNIQGYQIYMQCQIKFGQPCFNELLFFKLTLILREIIFIVQTIEKGEELCIWMCLSFFLFFAQNQVLQKINGLS